MRALVLLNPSRYGFGSQQRRKPFSSGGGLLHTVHCFYVAFQHQSDLVVTPSSPTTGILGVGFRFSTRALALFQRRQQTQFLGFHSSIFSVQPAGWCTSSIVIPAEIVVGEGLMLVPDLRRSFSTSILWDPIQFWDPGSVLLCLGRRKNCSRAAWGFSTDAVLSQGLQDLCKAAVGLLRAVHEGSVGSAVVGMLYGVTLKPMLVVDDFDQAYHNRRIRIGWVSRVFWVLFVVGVSREVWVQFYHGFKI